MQRRQFDFGGSACAAFLALTAACGPTPREPGALERHHTLVAAGRCHVSVPDDATLQLVRARLSRRPRANLTYEIALEAQHSAGIGLEPRIWIGTPNSRGAETALANLGVERISDGFRFLGEEFAGRGDGLIATLDDPERPSAVLTILLGNDLKTALQWVADWTPTSRTGWQDFRACAVHREGAVDGGGRASPIGMIEVGALEVELTQGAQHGARADFDWSAAPSFDPTLDEEWFSGLDRASEGVRARLGAITPFDARWRLALRIFETSDELARVCRAQELACLRPLEPQAELSLVHVSGWPDNAGFELARAAALVSASDPGNAWLLDGVAAAAAQCWYGRSDRSWLAHLATGDLIPSVEQLALDDAGLSPHVASPLRGALLLACEELHGADFAARHWATKPAEIELPSDQAFRAWLARALEHELVPARRAREERRAAAIARPTRRGACLVPSRPLADPLGRGFGSRACEESLAQLRKLGASAVALSWCSALEPSEPRVFGAGREPWTQAGDAALLTTMLRANRLGLAVVLLPQLVASEHGGWAGQVMLTTHRSQLRLFEAWREFLVNLGLLAELAGADVLSLGTESPDSAVTRVSNQNPRRQVDLERLRSDWRFLIEASRGAFAGGLTYAARWDGEAQGIEFWKDLDFLGQNMFLPVERASDAAAAGQPSAAEFTQRIVGSFAHLKRLAGEHGVRPLVCGMGISSTADGWRQPSRPLGALDLDLQLRFYDGLRRALQIGRNQAIAPAGLFAWCWWSDPESGGELERGFTPQNKPAESAFARALQVR